MKQLLVLSLIILLGVPSIGQVKMRTRILTSLTNIEIEEYLKRNDVIFIPIGPIEVHGGLPVDCEYVGPLAVAMNMAEKADGLVLPHLAFCYPGGTTVGRGTIYVSSSDFLDYLKIVAHSLLRQGFKTQIYITGHGGSYLQTGSLVREFLDETKVPILAIDLNTARSNYGTQIAGSENFMYGAYSIAGRLEDVQQNEWDPEPESQNPDQKVGLLPSDDSPNRDEDAGGRQENGRLRKPQRRQRREEVPRKVAGDVPLVAEESAVAGEDRCQLQAREEAMDRIRPEIRPSHQGRDARNQPIDNEGEDRSGTALSQGSQAHQETDEGAHLADADCETKQDGRTNPAGGTG